ncbi:NRDE family protein [Stenotrophomonas sp. SY1]|uniref:NRDE family protein n=1 Tax=Stenotrophomonas sp. SY1 TaxID=477235 RepID=UPI001E592360|nr:NRDE family protein [Stenotrophomonas sp. SY1]MCD9085969.1 NRDE family protein [Stenotrophomonas sp. SY1]
MCLVTFAWKCHPRWRLFMAGNRDEFHARPTAPLQRWPAPLAGVIAGRDLRSGGSWMGVNTLGHAAVVTNVRDPTAPSGGPSRGELIAGYLGGTQDATTYVDALANRASEFAPFNLLVADAEHCCFLGNHPALHLRLPPGIHGMSNGTLDAPWPKTRRLMQALEQWLARDEITLDGIWQALADESRPPDEALPHTGIPLELERRLSSAFIRGTDYGTRASTVIAIDHEGQGFIHERRFGPEGVFLGETRVEIPHNGE